ncbi:MAG: hypothetical protein HY020_23735, partial [Burkholderiales bacterium]|nr:hypothetical protein [Burkholderiales bacterium]
MAYLPPFRLYLVMSVMFFLIASIWPGESVHLLGIDSDTKPGAAATPQQRCKDIHSDIFQSQMLKACENIVRDGGESFKHQVVSTAPKAMFIFLP